MFRKVWLLSLLILLPALLLACGDDDGDGSGASSDPAKQEVEQTIRNAVDAYNRQNVDAFLSYWTDKGLEEEFETTRQELRNNPEKLFGGPPLSLRSVSNTKISGNKATTEGELVSGLALTPERFELVREGGVWKIDGTQELTTTIPMA